MEPSRRSVLKLGALGICSLATLDLLAACSSGSSGASIATASPSASLASFVEDTTAGTATGLPQRVAWASTADSEFFLALGAGKKAAATARGVDYVMATSGADPSKHVDQVNQFLARGVGALAMQPLDPTADAAVLLRAIKKGVCAQGIITDPSTLQIAASQYQIGFDQGKAAVAHIQAKLGGSAEVAYFNLDTLAPALKTRHQGVLAGLKTGGSGVKVVSDVTVADVTTEAGFNAMSTVIQAHPDVKVVLGGDTIVVGAYHALQQGGKLKDDMFLAGVDGDSEALTLIKQGGPYRLSIAFAWGLMGYGLGQFGADWIAGKQIPRVIVAKGVLLDSASAVTDFERASKDPAPVFADRTAYEKYLPLLGNTSYAQRSTYWTTEVVPP